MPDSGFLIFLSKLLPVFAYPLGFGLVCCAMALLCAIFRKRHAAFVIALIGFAELWMASTPAFCRWALSTLESQYQARPAADMPVAEVAFLLGGSLQFQSADGSTIDMGSSSDRIEYARALYAAGKVKRIVVTGGTMPWDEGGLAEAEAIKTLLVNWGVAPESVIVVGQSRNTYEDALFIRQMLGAEAAATPALLVTSAFHMPRALAIFQKAGFNVTPAPTDVRARNRKNFAIADFLPDSEALDNTSKAIKEWIGIAYYRLRGLSS